MSWSVRNILFSILLLLSGCFSNSTSIRLKSSIRHESFYLDFANAYLMREPAGDYHVVLVSEPYPESQNRGGDRPLEPVASVQPRQLLHIHIFWRPLQGLKADHPSATNSTLDLFVIGDQGQQTNDLVHYQGIGFVALHVSANEAEARISNASLEPRFISGAMSDALGKCTLEGTILAQPNAQRVRELLDQINGINQSSHNAQARVERQQ
jgi:hypothetical protein